MGLFTKKEKRSEDVTISYLGGNLSFNSYSSYNPNKAMLIAAVYRCVNVISDGVAQLPIHIHKIDGDGYITEATNHPASRLLNKKPNKRMNRYTFMKLMVCNMLLKGNAYAYIKRENGVVKELVYLPTEYVTVTCPNAIEDVIYQIHGIGKVDSSDIIHLINYPSNEGHIGLSTIKYATKSLTLAFDELDTADGYYRSGANRAGILTTDKSVGKLQREQIFNDWTSAFNGTNGVPNGVAVLPQGVEYTPLQMSSAEAELIASRNLSTLDIARFFGVNPSKVFDTSNQSYSTVEAQNLDFLTNCLQPLLAKIENELNTKLFNEMEDDLDVEFDTSVLLRTDKKALVEYFNKLFIMGAMSPNEIRKELGYSKVDGGDEHFMQVNISTIDKITSMDLQDNPNISNQLKEEESNDTENK